MVEGHLRYRTYRLRVVHPQVWHSGIIPYTSIFGVSRRASRRILPLFGGFGENNVLVHNIFPFLIVYLIFAVETYFEEFDVVL